MASKTSTFDVNETMDTKQSNVIGIIALVILIAILGAYWQYQKHSNKNDNSVVPATKVNKVNVDFSKLPDHFPKNIPLEAKAQITQNYNADAQNGQYQATRTFQTNVSLADNYKKYTDFLTKDGWKIESSIDEPTYKMVMGSKGKLGLLISIDTNQVTKNNTVSLTYTESPF